MTARRRTDATMLVVALTAWSAGIDTAAADPAIRVGPRGGLELRDGADAVVGLDLRMSFPLSPLTINPTFFHVLDPTMSIEELNVNALYPLPVTLGRLDPYVGIGLKVTRFSYKDRAPRDVDDNGNRMGLNLIGGVCVDLPLTSVFVEVQSGVGELTAFAAGAGLAIALDGDARWDGCGRRRP